MMTLVYNGVEKLFADWGLEESSADSEFIHLQTDIFTARMVGVRIDDDPLFPYLAPVVIWKNRVEVEGVFSGGVIEFQGKRMLHVLEGRPEFEGVTYQFGGPWYDIENTPYQQDTIEFNGDPDALVTVPLTEIVLFQKVTAPGVLARRNSGEQITDILQHLLDEYATRAMPAPFQIGTIQPEVQLPTYQVRDVMCSEVIEICLRSSPSASFWFDYSTTPPKAHCILRASSHAANVVIADGVKHESLTLTPRYDLQPDSVIVNFRQQNTLPTGTWLQVTKQKAPAAGPDGGFGVVIQTVDLMGFTVTAVTGDLETDQVFNTRGWWQVYVPELASLKVRNFTVGAMSIKDKNSVDVNLATYPNVLRDGSSVKPWMQLPGGAQVRAVQVTIKALASWDQYDVDATGDPQTSVNGRLVGRFIQKELHHRLTLTNGLTGNYSAESSFTDAEPVPLGLADAIYNELSVLQYQGTVTIVEQEVSGAVSMGNVVNLTNGRAEWAVMNAQLQRVHRMYGAGRTELTLGPARFLGAGDLTEIFLVNRLRRVWTNPALQATAQASAGSIDLGGNVPKENTNVGLEVGSVLKATADLGGGNKAEVVKDAAGQKLVVQVTDATGTRSNGYAWIEAALADLGGRQAKFRWLYFKDAKNGCAAKKLLVLGTDPEADV